MRTALALAVVVAVTALSAACQGDEQARRPTDSAAQRDAATPTDRNVMRSLVRFARSPSDSTWRRLRLARRVELGLGKRLVVQRSRGELRDPDAWRLDADHFRGRVGSLSALRLIADEPRRLRLSVGPHAHCAAPPTPPPGRVARLRRVSVQPERPDSCLSWWSVDVYVDRGRRVRAVTLDLWEP